MTTTDGRRRYRSVRRAEQARQTRADLIASATRLFGAQGWAATGMRDIARDAGVATETVYAHFPSKAALLQAAVDVLVVGDDAAVPLAGRDEFAAIGHGSRAERIAAAAAVVTAVNQRTAGLAKVLREAAPSDEAMAAALTTAREHQRQDVATGARLILGRDASVDVRDGAWALSSFEVYGLLVEHAGWSHQRYESWIASALDALLPEQGTT